MEEINLIFDLHASGSKSDKKPVYRIYIDDYLITERTHIYDSFDRLFIQENCPILANNNEIDLTIEWIKPAFFYNIKNILIANKKTSVDCTTNDKKIFRAKINYEDI